MPMRITLALNLIVASILLPASASAQTWTDFEVDGVTRKALVYVPSGIDNPPLLLSLHGMGIGAGWHQGEMMKFEPIADREKFIVVYPEADQDLRWDLGGTHDIDFMLKIIDEMSAQHGIDLNRVYASGFSMGGMFSYTLACKIPDKIAAIAPGDGYPLGGERGCVTTRSVPIFHMHGTADDFVKYSTLHAFLDTKIDAYGCPTSAIRTEPYPTSNPESQSFKEYWGPCTDDAGQQSEIILISVTGMIHDWATAGKANANEDPAFAGKPFDIDGSEEAWAFLKTHSLADTASAGQGGSGAGSGSTAGSGGVGDAGASGAGGAGAGDGGVGGALAGHGGAGAAGSTSQPGSAGAAPAQGGASGATQPSSAGASPLVGMAGRGAESTATRSEPAGCACVVARSSGSVDGAIAWLLAFGLLLRRSISRQRLAKALSKRSNATVGRLLLAALLLLPTACTPDDGDDDTGDRAEASGGTGGASGIGGGLAAAGSAGLGAAGTGSAGSGIGSAGSGIGHAGSGTGNAGSGIAGAGGADAGAAGGGSGDGASGGSGGEDSGTSGDGGSSPTCPLPTSFSWTSSGPLAEPQSPANHDFVSLKDFTIARAGDEYAVYATAFDSTASWTGVYFSFSDFTEIGSVTQTWLDDRATVAPQLMYFTPKDIWVLTYQWGFQYATSTDPHDPDSWSQGSALLTGNPTAGHGGTGPIDQTVICDSTDCYIFFAGDNGRIYRGSMPIGDFPDAFTNTTQIMEDTTARLFEGVEVYSVKGSAQYLMIVEAMGAGGRYFRAFTADDLGGTFTAMPQASSEDTPFAGRMNVTFTGDAWTNDISHGDIVREDPSEKKPIDPCDLKFLYQGRNPAINVDYGLLPYRPGLLTLTQ